MPDRPVTACLVVIGNEILSGRTRDANLAYLGARLNDMRPYEREGGTFSQAAFRWVLSNPDVDALVVSMNAPDMIDEYVAASGSHYASEIGRSDEQGKSLLRIAASFRTAYGSHRRREIVLWQKVVRPEGLLPLLTREVPARFKAEGTWMHDALAVRDRWQSRLLRSARWSPWH